MASRGKKAKKRRTAGARKRRHGAGARRFVLLFLFVLVSLLYAGPLRSYYAKREIVNRQREQVAMLRSEHTTLETKLRKASTREAAEREARRRLSYVKPGERLYIVKGIERWRRDHAGGGH